MNDLEKNAMNGLMNEKQFIQLAGFHGKHCISIFLPTFRAGEEVDSGKSRIILKNLLKEVRAILDRLKLGDDEILKLLKPVDILLDDIQFWRNQSDGLAIFLKDGEMEYFTLPVHFREWVYVADHFYMLPLIPFFNDDGRFYLLALSLKSVKFYECSRHMITELSVGDLVPENLEQVVGHDHQQKSLQFRTGQSGREGAIYHGHGSGKDDKHPEVEKFFQAVDKGLMSLLNDEDAPLVLACVDEHYPVYKESSGYAYIFSTHISGNPEARDPILLHEMAWELVKGHFRQQREEMAARIRRYSATGKTSYDIKEIVPFAVDGRVSALFLKEDTDEFGLYDELTRSLVIPDHPDEYQVSLFNMAVVNTVVQGGKAFVAKENEMPLKFTGINALFRY